MSVSLTQRWLTTDLDRNPTPFVKSGLALAFSGTLYNDRELRAELVARGVAFQSPLEVELVLEAWRYWGSGCLRRFRGTFAFSVFEERTSSLYLARDQFGIQPLHYLRREDGVVFASELNALVAVLGHELTVDHSALVAAMLYAWVPERRCAIHSVEKLRPGTWVRFDPDGRYETGRYWDIAEVAAAAAAGPPLDLEEVIGESVTSRLARKASVTALTDGGLDSMIVAAFARRHIPQLEVLSVTFPVNGRSVKAATDSYQARKAVDRLGVNVTETEVSDLCPADLLPRLVDSLDEPMGDPAGMYSWLVYNAAHQAGANVVLSGVGADELLGGYRRHVACLLSARYQRLPLAARDALNSIIGTLPLSTVGIRSRHIHWAKRFLTFSELPEEAAFRRSYSLYDPVELGAMIGSDFGRHVDDLIGEHLELYWDNHLQDQISRMCLADARHLLPGLHLACADRASQAASMEVHLPFVDPVVFRAAFSVTGAEKVRGLRGNIPLREVTRDSLPESLLYRARPSPSVLLRAWFTQELGEILNDALTDGLLVGSGLLRREAVEHLWSAEQNGREDRARQLWQLFTLELWCQKVRASGVGL